MIGSMQGRLYAKLIPTITKINKRFVPEGETERGEFIINFIKSATQEKIEQLSQEPSKEN